MTSRQTEDSTTATTARMVVWSYVDKRFSTGRLSPWHRSPWYPGWQMQDGARSSFTYLHSPWMQKSLYFRRHGSLFFPNPLPFFFLFPRSSLLGVARACGLEEKAALKRSRSASSKSKTSRPRPPPGGSSWSVDSVGEPRLLVPAASPLRSRSRLSPVTNAESTAARKSFSTTDGSSFMVPDPAEAARQQSLWRRRPRGAGTGAGAGGAQEIPPGTVCCRPLGASLPGPARSSRSLGVCLLTRSVRACVRPPESLHLG